jgi:hypothetical protein
MFMANLYLWVTLARSHPSSSSSTTRTGPFGLFQSQGYSNWSLHLFSGRPLFSCFWAINRRPRNTALSVSRLHNVEGRDTAQTVGRGLPTAVPRVRSQVKAGGFLGGQSGTGACFFRVLRFPLPILIPPTAPHSSSIIRGWYNRANSGRSTKWTQSHPTPRIKKKLIQSG